MKPKLVRHRLPPVIGFENLQLKFRHAELSAQLAASSRAQGCVAGPSVSSCPPPPAAQPGTFGGQRKKPAFSSSTLHLPVLCQDGRGSCRAVLEPMVC